MKPSNNEYRSTYQQSIDENNIRQTIQRLIRHFERVKSKIAELTALNTERDELNAKNADYLSLYEDKRQHTHMLWYACSLPLLCLVDFVTTWQPLSVLEEYGAPGILKYLAPLGMVGLEAAIGYSQKRSERNGEHHNWLSSNLQYTILFFFVALSGIAIWYELKPIPGAQEHDFGFSTWTFIVFQVALLIVSLVLHYWLIKNSEHIFEAFGFLNFKRTRSALDQKIKALSTENIRYNVPEFTNLVSALIRNLETFKRTYSEVTVDFSQYLPADLVKAINKLMGRDYFRPPFEYSENNYMYEQDTSR